MRIQVIVMCLGLISASQALSVPDPTIAWTKEDIFTFTYINGQIPDQIARIKRYWTKTTPFAANGQTGDFYIHYSDGVTVLAWKAPGKKVIMPAMGSPDNDAQIGVDLIKVAGDGRTLGWAEIIAPCCESYPLPASIGVYKPGKKVLHIEGPGMLDYWAFLDAGRHIVAVWGPAHGPQILEYQIIDTETQRVIAGVTGNPDTQALDSDAPKWARQAQAVIQAR